MAVPLADENVTALVIPALWEYLWSNKIREFEHDSRRCRSMTVPPTRNTRRPVSDGSPQRAGNSRSAASTHRVNATRPASRSPFSDGYWGDNMFGDGHIREHPLVGDRWLLVDAVNTR